MQKQLAHALRLGDTTVIISDAHGPQDEKIGRGALPDAIACITALQKLALAG